MERCISDHPHHFYRQIAVAHAALHNAVLPDDIRQVSIDYEPVGKAFLIALLKDKDSIAHRLFATQSGKDFLNSFDGIATAWKPGEAPFDQLELYQGYPRFVRTPHSGIFSIEDIGAELEENRIIPKTGLLFLLYLLEGGLAPLGGMRQTRYATQIRDLAAQWLEKNCPGDKRISALAKIPTELACLTPAWGLHRKDSHQPLSYDDALQGWRMDKDIAHDLLQIDGATALRAGLIIMSNILYEKETLGPEQKTRLLRELYGSGRMISI